MKAEINDLQDRVNSARDDHLRFRVSQTSATDQDRWQLVAVQYAAVA